MSRAVTRSFLHTALVLTALAGAWAACAVDSTGSCATDADCLGGAVCIDGLCSGGEVPTAAFEAPETVPLGATVALDGSESRTAADSTTGLTWRWTVKEPEGAVLEATDGPSPRLLATLPHATYRVELVVLDHGTASAPVERTIRVANTAPVARLSSDPDAWPRSTTIALSAATSTDADGDALTWTWTLVKDPETAPGELLPDGAAASLTTGATAGRYTVTVEVSDGELTDSTSLAREIGNTPPEVSAGDAQTVDHSCALGVSGARECVAEAQLSGVATDLEGEPASLVWTLKSAPAAAILTNVELPVQAATGRVRFTAEPGAPFAGEYELELAVTDNDGVTSVASTIVTVGNRAPVLEITPPAPRFVPHTFDAVNGRYVAQVEATLVYSDPDGDDLVRTFEPLPAELPGVTTALEVDGDGATWTLEVAVGNETSLLDGELALHELVMRVTDVNQATAEVRHAFVVENRPPSIANLTDLSTGRHTFAGGLYSDTFEWAGGVQAVDPDGDPVTLSWEASAQTAQLTVSAGSGEGGRVDELTLSAPEPAFVTEPIGVTMTAADPWSQGSASASLQAGNRLPSTSGFGAATVAHRFGPSSGCAVSGCYYGDFPTRVEVTDPDGDPAEASLAVTSPAPQFSARQTGTAQLGVVRAVSPSPTLVTQPLTATLTASDPFGAVETEATWTLGNTAPQIAGHAAQVATQHTYQASPAGYRHVFTASVALTDADGDPLTDAWTLATSGVPATLTVAGAPAAKALTLFSSDRRVVTAGVPVILTVSDGIAQVTDQQSYRLGNRAPQLAGHEVQVATEHTYLASPAGYRHVFTANVTLADPDGDPLTDVWTLRTTAVPATLAAAGAPAAKALTVFSADTRVVTLGVPVVVTASDGFAQVSDEKLYRMGNRTPTAVTGLVDQDVTGHAYGTVPGGQGYFATYPVPPLTLADPDGDPAGAYGFARVSGPAANLEVSGPAAAPTALRVSSTSTNIFSGPVGVGVVGTDPFGAASPRLVKSFSMSNRPPSLGNFASQTVGLHTYSASSRLYSHVYPLSLSLSDPDGDPTTVELLGFDPDGVPGLVVELDTAHPPRALQVRAADPSVVTASVDVALRAADGMTTSSSVGATFEMGNRTPTFDSVSIGNSSVFGQARSLCTSGCDLFGFCAAPATSVRVFPSHAYQPPLAATPADPDGDPVQVTWTITSGSNNFLTAKSVGRDLSSAWVDSRTPTSPAEAALYGVLGTCRDAGATGSVTGFGVIRTSVSDPFQAGAVFAHSLRVF